MTTLNRRRFVQAAGVAAGSAAVRRGFAKTSPNDRINVAVIGIRGQGRGHLRAYSAIPNVAVTTLCDVDENLFADRVKMVGDQGGNRPDTVTDLRRVLDDPDIDAVSIAMPDHWHALAAVWACQAGKDVYLEKPVSHNVSEGRRIVEAARKYDRVVMTGTQSRSSAMVREAMELLHSGRLGRIYMAKALCFKPRDSIGRKPDGPVPPGVHYDLWLGPAPNRPFNPNRFHYNWHWFWDYGTTDMGNQGIHQMDIARWGLNKREHPRYIHGVGGYYAFDSDQETPNTQMTTFEYADGTILQFEVRGLYTNDEDGIRIGNLFYGTEGWMHLARGTYATYFGRKNEPGPAYQRSGGRRGERKSHQAHFIDGVRSRNWRGLSADILEGHMSSALCLMGNVSYRVGRKLTFDGHAERFVNDDIANGYLTRNYRHPFVVPEHV